MTHADEGIVYYALDASRRGLYLKIGFTTDLASRIPTLSKIATSGQAPIVLALEEGGRRVEQKRHGEFVALRSHGEWFRYDEPLRSHVASLEHPIGFLLDRPHLWEWSGGWGTLSTMAKQQRNFRERVNEDPDGDEDDPLIDMAVDF